MLCGAAVWLGACGGETPPARGPEAAAHGMSGVSSGTEVERFFPLVDGNVYHYATESDAGQPGLLVVWVFRNDAGRGELRYARGSRRFEYAADGVRVAGGGAYVLKLPLTMGASWPGEHGGTTRVIAVDAVAAVPAGQFTGCVQTLEERRGDQPARWATTFCPDTGIVLLEVASGANLERAELKSYGRPVVLGPDGLEKTPVAPQSP